MASTLSIFNSALLKMGSAITTDVTSSESTVASLRNVYEICRKSLLESANWKFAIKTKSLSLVTAQSGKEWGYIHSLPADFVRMKDLHEEIKYEIRGSQIFTDASVLTIEYIADIEDTNDFSSGFTKTLIVDMALAAGGRFLDSASRVQLLMAERREEFKTATKNEAMQTAVIQKRWDYGYFNNRDNPYGKR